jgi:hypothetical protein
MHIQIDTRNIQVLEDFFKDMAYSDKRKIFISAFRKCAKPILAAARVTVPRRTGKLARSLGSDTVRDEISLIAGAMRRRGGHVAHLVESGTVERQYRSKKGVIHRTGKLTATHFFENAYNSTEAGNEQTIADEIFSEVFRRIDKMKAKLKK